MVSLIKYISWLSLDVAIGGVVLLYFVGNNLDILIPESVAIALGLSIWLIYTADHLLDVVKLDNPTSGRHIFHKENRKGIIVCLFLAIIIGGITIQYLPDSVVFSGVIIGLFCILYLALSNFIAKKGIKEFLVAIVYAIGIFVYPIIEINEIGADILILIVQLGLVAFINIILIAYFDFESDSKDGFVSIAIFLGKPNLYKLIITLSVMSIVFSTIFLLIIEDYLMLEIFYISSSLMLLFILLNKSVFCKEERFRLFGDGIFFIPLILQLF